MQHHRQMRVFFVTAGFISGEAQTIMEDLKHEIGDLKCKVTTITLEATNRGNAKCEALRLECEAERREVLVLKERCNGLRNVLLASSIGFCCLHWRNDGYVDL